MTKYYIFFYNLHMYLKEFGTYNAILIAFAITLIYLLFTVIKSGKSAVKLKKIIKIMLFSV